MRVHAVLEKKGEVYGNQQAVPLDIGHSEISQKPTVAGNTFVFCSGFAAEQHGAGVARTMKPALCQFNQVRMLGAQFGAAHIAFLHQPRWFARELA
jgi:hypothetical protein